MLLSKIHPFYEGEGRGISSWRRLSKSRATRTKVRVSRKVQLARSKLGAPFKVAERCDGDPPFLFRVAVAPLSIGTEHMVPQEAEVGAVPACRKHSPYSDPSAVRARVWALRICRTSQSSGIMGSVMSACVTRMGLFEKCTHMAVFRQGTFWPITARQKRPVSPQKVHARRRNQQVQHAAESMGRTDLKGRKGRDIKRNVKF